jgi:hypothetical protein
MSRPDDLWRSDVGPWPNADASTAPIVCVGCGRRGGRDGIARDHLCWSCWALAWTSRQGTPADHVDADAAPPVRPTMNQEDT